MILQFLSDGQGLQTTSCKRSAFWVYKGFNYTICDEKTDVMVNGDKNVILFGQTFVLKANFSRCSSC